MQNITLFSPHVTTSKSLEKSLFLLSKTVKQLREMYVYPLGDVAITYTINKNSTFILM